MYKPDENDRRRSPRLRAQLEAELVTDLSFLDGSELQDSDASLVFMGVTHNVSANGLAVVVPSIRMDESYCEQARPISLALHLPDAAVQMKIEPIHCTALTEKDPDQGYLIGARITSSQEVDEHEWQKYVEDLAGKS